MKILIFLSFFVSLGFTNLFAAEGEASKEQALTAKNLDNPLHMLSAFGDSDQLELYIKKLQSIEKLTNEILSEDQQKNPISPTRRDLLTSRFDTLPTNTTGAIGRLNKSESSVILTKVEQKLTHDDGTLRATKKIQRLKITLPKPFKSWAFLEKHVGKKVRLELPDTGWVNMKLDAVECRLCPEAFFGLSPLDIAILQEDEEMAKFIVDFVLEDSQVWPAILGQVLCHKRLIVGCEASAAPGVNNPWLQRRLERMLRLRPELANAFMKQENLTVWLEGDEASQANSILGPSIKPSVPLPGVFFASRARHLPALRALVERGAYTNYVFHEDRFKRSEEVEESLVKSTLLSLAANGPEHRAVDLLLQGGADCDLGSPLFFAAWRKNTPTMEVLLKAGADPHSALYLAARRGQPGAVEVLLKTKADPNKPSPLSKLSPFRIAKSQLDDAKYRYKQSKANNDDPEKVERHEKLVKAYSKVIELLSKKIAELDDGRTAESAGHHFLEEAQQAQISDHLTFSQSLHRVAAIGRWESMEKAFYRTVELYFDYFKKRKLDLKEEILDKKVAYEEKEQLIKSLLYGTLASPTNRKAVLEELVFKHERLNGKDYWGFLILTEELSPKKKKSIKILLDQKPITWGFIKNFKGKLIRFQSPDNINSEETLVASGCNMFPDLYGEKSPLEIALLQKNKEMIKFLIDLTVEYPWLWTRDLWNKVFTQVEEIFSNSDSEDEGQPCTS